MVRFAFIGANVVSPGLSTTMYRWLLFLTCTGLNLNYIVTVLVLVVLAVILRRFA